MKHQEIKDIAVASYTFLSEVPSKLEIQSKRLYIFYVILVGVLYCLLFYIVC